jgi:hypothetical protein
VVRELEQAVPRDARGKGAAVATAGAAAAGKLGASVVQQQSSKAGQHVVEDPHNLPAVPVMEED